MPSKQTRKWQCATHPKYNLKRAPEGESRQCSTCTRLWNKIHTDRRRTLVRNRCRRDGTCRVCRLTHKKIIENGMCLSCVFMIDNIDSSSESRNWIRHEMQECDIPLRWTE